MKKKIFLAKISMVFAVFVLCLSVFAFVSLDRGLAWFANNKKADTSGLSVSLTDEQDIIESFAYYAIEDIKLVQTSDQSYNEYLFSYSGSNLDNFALQPLSAIDAKRQVMLKITFKSEMELDIFAKAKTRRAYPKTFSNAGNDLSSVVEFYTLTNPREEDLEEGQTEPNYTVSGTEEVLGGAKRFAEITRDESGAITSKSFDDDGQIQLYSSAEGERVKDIYILFDYYEESMDVALEYANEHELGDKGNALEPPKIYFTCDFSIVFAPKGEA